MLNIYCNKCWNQAQKFQQDRITCGDFSNTNNLILQLNAFKKAWQIGCAIDQICLHAVFSVKLFISVRFWLNRPNIFAFSPFKSRFSFMN